MNSIFETPKIIPTVFIVNFQDIFEPHPPDFSVFQSCYTKNMVIESLKL